MAITEESRHNLYQRLEEVLGRDEAATLMEHLPPVGWADVATKRDLDHLAVATKRDLDHLAVATKRDLDHLAVATKRDLDHLGALLTKNTEGLGNVLRAEFARGQRNLTLGVMAMNTTLIGFVLAAAKLT